MATGVAHPTDSSLQLYRLGSNVYARLRDAGMLGGVALVDGLLVDGKSVDQSSIHRLDLDTYNEIVATGELEGERVELLEGLLVEMSPHRPAHSTVIERLTRHFATAKAWLRVQLPVEALPSSEPEPDLALTEGQSLEHHPRAALLVVEVAVTSQRKDRGKKADVYARAGMPLYWLVDVPAKTVEVRSEPGPKGYRQCETYGIGTRVPSPAEGVADLDVAVLFDGVGA